MAINTFCGRIISEPKQLETTKEHRPVVHVIVSFVPTAVKINGKLPELNDSEVSTVQLSFWDEEFMAEIMKNAKKLVGKTITGYCDDVRKNGNFHNANGYAFVETPKAKPIIPKLQVITKASTAPTAPVAPVA